MPESPSTLQANPMRPVQLAEQLSFYLLDDVTPIVEFLEQFRLLQYISLQNRHAVDASFDVDMAGVVLDDSDDVRD